MGKRKRRTECTSSRFNNSDNSRGAGIGGKHRRFGTNYFRQYYKKLGFRFDIKLGRDFIDAPPENLALDCMAYFARNYTQQYTKVVHENEHECPFGRTSVELVKMLCEIIGIELLLLMHGIFFDHDHPFEEFFCICIITLNRTWKDMRATAEDFQKVLSVVREQIIRAFRERPQSFEDFRCKIAQLNYQTIRNLQEQERMPEEKYIIQKEKISPDIINLIKQHRLSFLVNGTRFSKYFRGVLSKDKFWYAQLSPDHKVIHYGDCDENAIPTLEDLTHKVLVIDIKQLLVGKECPHMKEMRTRKSAANLCFSITFDNMDHSTLDFVAPEERTFFYWTDGINTLLGQEMCSKQKA